MTIRPAALFSSLTLSLTLMAGCDPEQLDSPGDSEPEIDPKAVVEGAGGFFAPKEVCAQEGAMRECDDGEGTQFCDHIGGWNEPLTWGECQTNFECMPGDSYECFPGDEIFAGLTANCDLIDGVPYWNLDGCNTPLVLSFDRGPIEMISSSAAFDISGAGECVSTDWPAERNPWLVIDLDQNGYIDGGHELFGSGSVLTSGRHAQNGFLALGELDDNGDGIISVLDRRFGELQVWRDVDGDKQSTPFELSSLADEGVQQIELAYGVAEQCDERGNCGRERASFSFVGAGGQEQVGEVVDVHLSCQ